MKLTDMFRILHCGIMQICAGILKKWAFECSGLAWFCQCKPNLLNLLLFILQTSLT